MPSHSERPVIWLSVWKFLLTHCLYERAAEVLARLRECAGSPEPSLLAYTISTKFAWRGPNMNCISKLESAPFRMSLVTRKSVFWVCDQVRHKPACAATEARQRLEISDIETTCIILSRQRTTTALIRLRGCAGWSAPFYVRIWHKQFSHDVAHT